MRAKSQISEAQSKRQTLLHEIETLKTQTDPYLEEVRALKTFLENEISALSKKRPVHIIGEINNLLRRQD